MKKKILSVMTTAAMMASLCVMPQNAMADGDELLFTDRFEEILAWGKNYNTDHAGVGDLWKPTDANTVISLDSELGMYKTLITSRYNYAEGLIKKYQSAGTVNNLSGHIKISTKFKALTDGKSYLPITVYGNTGAKNKWDTLTLFRIDTNTDKFYAMSTDLSTLKTSWVEVADATDNKWYDITLDVYVGGDATTIADDYFYYTLNDGEDTFTGGPYNLYATVSGGASNKTDMTAISMIGIGYTYSESSSCEVAGISAYQMAEEEVPVIPATFTSSIADGATDVSADTKEVVLTFDKEMDATTFENITVDGASYEVTPASGASETATVKFTSDLDYETTYKITVPETVLATDGAPVEAGTVSFTTEAMPVKEDELIFTDRFDEILAWGKNYNTDHAAVGDLWKVGDSDSVISDDSEIGMHKTTLTSRNGYAEGLIKRYQSAGTINNLSGHIKISTKFKALTDGKSYLPISLYGNTGAKNKWDTLTLFRIDTNTDKFYAMSTDPSTLQTGWVEVADATENKWYDITLDVYVGGDATTIADDCFYYTINDGENTYVGGPYNIYTTVAGGTSNKTDMTAISQIGIGYMYSASSSCEVAGISAYQMAEEEPPVIPATFTSSIKDGTADVSADTEEVVLTFNKDMDATTFENITVNGVAYSVTPVSGTSKTATVKFESKLDYETTYKITVPETVLATDGAPVEADTVSFTTGAMPEPEAEILFTDRFDEILAWGKNYNTDHAAVGDLWKVNNAVSVVSDDTEIGMHKTTLTARYNYAEGLIKRYQSEGTIRNVSGFVKISTKFKALTDGVSFLPISLYGNTGANNTWDVLTPLKLDTNNDKFFVASTDPSTLKTNWVEVADATENKWYDITLDVHAGDDAGTIADDYFYYTINDGENTYTGGPYNLYVTVAGGESNKTDMTAISQIGFGYMYSANASCEVADVKASVTPSPVFIADIEDGDKDVAVDGSFTLKFNATMKAESFTNIKLKNSAGEDVAINVTPYSGETKEVKITPADTLEFNRNYKLVIPSTVISTGYVGVEAGEINFSTEAMADILVVSNISATTNGGKVKLTKGSVIDISADYSINEDKNVESADAVLLAGIYNSDGTMIAVCYTNDTVTLNNVKTLKVNFTVPENVENGAYVKVFCWDTLEDMTPIAEAEVISE